MHQLGRRSAPCEEERGFWLLLCERHRSRDTRASQVRATFLLLLNYFCLRLINNDD